ncbi:MAG: helix-turn-helix domain-containing protein, partial [Chloroflexi bacterium]|nr:helix-turn-helix domain-containing protein [Chloroflexota bacterium]
MSPRSILTPAPPRVRQLTNRLSSDLGREVHDLRVRRGWTLAQLAEKAGVSRSMVQGVEAGEPSSVAGYVRLAMALGLTPRFTLLPETAARTHRDADPVHAAMGEV